MPETPHGTDPIGAAVAEQFRAGDRAAFVTVYGALAQSVRGWTRRFFKSPFEQEEAVQEIWLTAHRMAPAYDPAKGPLRPWLRTLASNRCKELLRARGRRIPEGMELSEALDVKDETPGPEDHEKARRVREAVSRFAATLPEDEAKVLQLGLADELSLDEVAEALGTNVRRCKYLKKKLLAKAATDEGLRVVLQELVERGEAP